MQDKSESDGKESSESLEDFMRNNYKLPWYRKLFPFFPIAMYNNNLRLLTVTFGDHSTTTKSLTKKHLFDVLLMNHRTKWYHPKYVGFQIWVP